jgi:hypothetical protein
MHYKPPRFANLCRPLAVLLLFAFPPVEAQAQLKGLGGSGGGGNIVGAPGRASSTPDIGRRDGDSLPGDAVPSTGSRSDGATLPSVTRPSDNVTNTLSGSVREPLPVPGSLTNTANQAVRNATRPNLSGRARPSGVPPAGERRFVPDEVVTRLAANLSPQAIDALAQQHNLTLIESQRIGLTGTTFYRWRITDRRSMSDVIRGLEAQASVAQPNYRFEMQEQAALRNPVMAAEPAQYVLAKLDLPRAHQLATGEKVLVGVIDSGIDMAHPEIAGLVAANFDALNTQEPPHTHGTAMAGAIVAHAKLVGAAPGAQILAIRAFGASSSGAEGTTLTLLKALDWAVSRGARVINMSFTGPMDPEIARALAAAHKRGAVLVAAAGNAGPKSPPLFPASDPNVIAVTATDANDKLLAVAARGRHIALAAPGVDILGPAPNAGYQLSSGTSVAAAHVSGIAALLLERKPSLTPDAVKNVLLTTASDLGPKGRDDQFGAGLVNAWRALHRLDEGTAEPKPASVSAAR